MTTSSRFCTECGSENKSENRFCIVCAASLISPPGSPVAETPSPVSSASSKVSKFEQVVEKPNNASRKRTILLVAVVILSFVAGVGLTSKNVLSAVVGDRYTEKDLKNEKQLSYKAGYRSGKDEGLKSGNAVGYDSGFEAGDDAGYSRGYAKGENDGCYKVFKKAEADQLIAISYPYRASDTGDFYITRGSTC
jgi:hypothetical protein